MTYLYYWIVHKMMFMVFLCVVVGCAMNTKAKEVKTEVVRGVRALKSSIEEHEVRITPFNDKQHLKI